MPAGGSGAAAAAAEENGEKKLKTREPDSKSKFKQQRLWAWQPVLSPAWVIGTFVFFGVFFVPLGAAILVASRGVVEASVRYDDQGCIASCVNACIAGNCACNWQCQLPTGGNSLTITVPKRMEPPVYIYYALDNYYQNHRRYVQSRSDKQLQGSVVTASTLDSSCSPITGLKGADSQPLETYSPCGLIAWSMFNDTISLLPPGGGAPLCDGGNPTGACTGTGIAWPADVDTKFKAPPPGQYLTFPNTYLNEPTHVIPLQTSEDLMVWMRTAALPNFRKLYRIYNAPLEAGTYNLQITERYDVSRFSGKKYVILSTSSWVGGKNDFLGIAFIVVGSLSFAAGVVFCIMSWRRWRHRERGQLKYH